MEEEDHLEDKYNIQVQENGQWDQDGDSDIGVSGWFPEISNQYLLVIWQEKEVSKRVPRFLTCIKDSGSIH